MSKTFVCSFLLSLLGQYTWSQTGTVYKISSPDASTSIELKTDAGKLLYRIAYLGNQLTQWSAMGLETNSSTIGDNTVVKGKTQKTTRERFPWRLGEEDTISNNYNEINLACRTGSVDYNVSTRVYDGSVAFRTNFQTRIRRSVRSGRNRQNSTLRTLTQSTNITSRQFFRRFR
jgi:alpha-glucosidase